MKSTSGAHFVALDHIRAIAALMVFVWHFTHGRNGYPIPFEGAPMWGPLVIFDEGHVGVALFMTLSGYLFAKLLEGKKVIFHLFFYNRILRLFPLLLLVIVARTLIDVAKAGDIRIAYWSLLTFFKGFIYPVWPSGGWSITAELHFYILLPLLLLLKKRNALLLLLIVLSAIGYRTFFYETHKEVQSIAYWTILGRIDQFVFGILGFQMSEQIARRHLFATVVAAAFITLYYWFDLNGGFYLTGGYPSPSSLWIWLPTIEGLAFSILIAWYDSSFEQQSGVISTILSRIGEYSYSIYLLHFFIVFDLARWINTNVIYMSTFSRAMFVSLFAFAAMIPIGYLSMKFVELPFLRHRRKYYARQTSSSSS